VLPEIFYRYSALRRLDLGRQVYDLFVGVCPVVFPVDLSDTDRARDLLCGGEKISARDAVHTAVMLNNGLTETATFDEGSAGSRPSGAFGSESTAVLALSTLKGRSEPRRGRLECSCPDTR
jgi:hypothetical protein